MQNKFDVIVLGGGPGGYPAAIRAAQNGKSVALVEARELGGTCLNRGCIPSKTLIASADVYKRIKEADEFGIKVGEVTLDYPKIVERKDRVVADVRKGLEGLIASNQIQLFRGFGKFVSQNEIKVTGKDNALLTAKNIIIATGSEPREFPNFPFDYERIHDSTSMLDIKKLPRKIIIVGGGVIGCEFASLYVAFGVEVVILEMMPRILPMECESVSNALTKSFQKRGITIETNALVESIKRTENGVVALLPGGKTYEGDMALISIGRKMNTRDIGLDKAGLAPRPDGSMAVNDKMETSVPGIFAIGDIASKWWLAHVASHQGLVAANNACGIPSVMHYNAVPVVIFTDPEIGTCGLSLKQAIDQGFNATVGSFPFQALGKSQAAYQTEGFAQIVTDRDTGQILGAQVVGHEAGTLVAEMAIAIGNELTIECITDTIHAHPTVTEAWMEAAFVARETPLHLPPKKKKGNHAKSKQL